MLNHALLVDDSKSARFALRKLLERNGLRVDIAENAEQALGYLNDNRPDVIFMDHFMPGMDGFEAVKILKNQPGTASIPVVMCTSKDGDAYMAEAHAIGAVDILSKPATPGSLEIVLDKLCKAANDAPTPASEPIIDIATDFSPENLFEQIVDVPVSEQPKPVAKPVMPILEDVVVPVEEIKRVAAAAAQEVVEREIADRVAKQLAEKVPEMREMVMANFNSVVRSMLKGYIDEAMRQAKQDFTDIVRTETRQVADEISREVVETAVKTQVHHVEETMHREMNEHLAEVYTNIGDLKAKQHLKKASSELEQQLQSQARDAAQEVSRETLAEVTDVAQQAAKSIAKEVAEEANTSIQATVDTKMSSALENVNQVARTEAAGIAWQKVEESQKLVIGKIGSAKGIAVFALVAAAAAIAINFVM